MFSFRTLACLLSLAVLACTPALPEGVDCARRTLVASDDGTLTAALDQAHDGDCVILRGGVYSQALTLDRAITLVAERDADVDIDGGDHDVALRVSAPGARVIGLRLTRGRGLGVLVSAAAVELRDLEVQDFEGGAIGIRCQDAGCARGDGAIVASGLHTRGGAFGLGMDGGQLALSDSDFRDHRSSSLQPGLGFFATGQSQIVLQRVEVSSCDTGLVVDGAELSLDAGDLRVLDNDDRGLWAQGLRGEDSSPALRIQGDSRFEGNGYVGLGLYDSAGARVEDAVVRDTRARPVPTAFDQIESIGDGLALLAGSADVEIRAAELSGNARAQLLVDQGGSGVRVDEATTLSAPAGAYPAVVQNTSEAVALPAGIARENADLPVRSDPALGLPRLADAAAQ